MNFSWRKINAQSAALKGQITRMSFEISQISLNYNGLDAVFQRMRKMQKIATPLSRLAMTIKRDSSGAKALLWFLICAFLRALRQKIILSLRLCG